MDFFLVVSPGFEDLAQFELSRWLPEEKAVICHGGLQLQINLHTGLELNRVLKIPTRILLRLTDFGCRDFPRLFKKISSFSWEESVPIGSQIDFEVSTHGSRLKIKRRIDETCRDGYKSYLKKQGLATSAVRSEPNAELPKSTVFIRIFDNVCTVSLDTSGELLHKRGLRKNNSEAPLRETIAAGLLYDLIATDQRDREKSVSQPERHNDKIELIDLMTGSGIFFSRLLA